MIQLFWLAEMTFQSTRCHDSDICVTSSMSVERYSHTSNFAVSESRPFVLLRSSLSVRAVCLSGSSTFEDSVCFTSVLQLQNCNSVPGVRSILIAMGSRAGRYNTDLMWSWDFVKDPSSVNVNWWCPGRLRKCLQFVNTGSGVHAVHREVTGLWELTVVSVCHFPFLLFIVYCTARFQRLFLLILLFQNIYTIYNYYLFYALCCGDHYWSG
jgi:hypothetical protein